jgi:hypothetical protein
MLLGALLGQVLDGQLQPVERLDLVRQHAGHAAALLHCCDSGSRVFDAATSRIVYPQLPRW